MADADRYRGLGFDISSAASIKKALQISGLNWKVHELPVEVVVPEETGTEHRLVVPARKALARPDKTAPGGWRILDIPSERYTPIQNEELMEMFFNIAKLGHMRIETAGAINGGERVFVVARLDSEFFFPVHEDTRVIAEDRTVLKVIMGGAHFHGFANTIDVSAERLVCTNGLRILEGIGRWRFIHKRELVDEDLNEVATFIENAQNGFGAYQEKATLLHNTHWPLEMSQVYIAELEQPKLLDPARKAVLAKYKKLNPKSSDFKKEVASAALKKWKINPADFKIPGRVMLATINNQPGAGWFTNTAWTTYNAVTYYVDHTKGRIPDNAVESAFYGKGAKMKARALELAVMYCTL